MNTQEIVSCLRQFNFSSKFFRGVFSIDKLPKMKIKRPFSIVINTDHSDGPGLHWVAIWTPLIGKIEYFDSFGYPPMNPEIILFINLNGKSFIYNNMQVQSNLTSSCGKFCILFILFRSRNIPYKMFLNLFYCNKKYNEYYVKTLFNEFYKLK